MTLCCLCPRLYVNEKPEIHNNSLYTFQLLTLAMYMSEKYISHDLNLTLFERNEDIWSPS